MLLALSHPKTSPPQTNARAKYEARRHESSHSLETGRGKGEGKGRISSFLASSIRLLAFSRPPFGSLEGNPERSGKQKAEMTDRDLDTQPCSLQQKWSRKIPPTSEAQTPPPPLAGTGDKTRGRKQEKPLSTFYASSSAIPYAHQRVLSSRNRAADQRGTVDTEPTFAAASSILILISSLSPRFIQRHTQHDPPNSKAFSRQRQKRLGNGDHKQLLRVF